MKLDFEKALTFVAKDPAWVNKTLAGTGISFFIFAIFIIPLIVAAAFPKFPMAVIIVLALCFIFSIVMSCALAGYIAETANKRINYNNSILPDWKDFGRHCVTGLKYFIGFMVYCLPVVLVMLLFLLLYISSSVSLLVEPPINNVLGSLLIFCTGLLLFFVYVVLLVLCPLMMANFFKNLKIVSFFDFKDAFRMLKGNVSNYVVLLLLFVALNFIAQFLCMILAITIIGVIFLPFLYFYLYLVMADITAQFVLTTKVAE